MSTYSELASRLGQSASEHLGTSFVSCYLGGSCARGEERPEVSDIDVLIVTGGRRKYLPSYVDRLPPEYDFVDTFAKEAIHLARKASSPRRPLRERVLILTIMSRDVIREKAKGALYYELKEARLLKGEEIRKDVPPPSWETVKEQLLERINRWRERMVVNLGTLDLKREPHRLASYAIMYSLPSAGAYLALRRRRVVTSKRDIPRAFIRSFPGFKFSSVLRDVLKEYIEWKNRDDDLERLSLLWVRSFKFLMEIRRRIETNPVRY